ncbi:hypothetical protein FE257_009643 [Aspergillus nanangensis]|uniref:NAD-dependent epimerase/dehydratase domain-containing protein n=1 Tax=Aspergillus nanangensis TaxID=2582783 RepID=A0AAD4CJK7_ASPNN|nr:hypothetical protein FE257_009643 [Aspergillus nanangensis]
MSQRRILFIGASGYIGGSILDRFLQSADAAIKSASYTALVRSQDQASKLKEHNVSPILFQGLNDTDILRKYASEHDIVVNSANAFNTDAAKALILGLSDRKKQTGTDTIYLHTSGTSSIGDYPVPTETADRWVLSDANDDVYAHLTKLEGQRPYAQRTTDIAVVDTGIAANVKTFIVMSPTIYGKGTGLFNQQTIQIPGIIKRALRRGKTPFHSTGAGNWDHVHIEDLSELYELLLSRILAQEAVPSGKTGIYFSENGHYNWREAAEKVATVGRELGALSTSEVEGLGSVEWMTCVDAAATASAVQASELGFASWSRTTADLGRKMSWAPKHGDASWQAHVTPTFKAVWEKKL